MTRPATRAYDQITIRVDPEVGRRLRDLATTRRVSVSRVVEDTLRIGVGLGPDDGKPREVGSALDWLVGTLSDDEAREILGAVSVHEQIDEEFWALPKAKKTMKAKRSTSQTQAAKKATPKKPKSKQTPPARKAP